MDRIHHSEPSMDRSNKTVRYLGRVCEPYSMMFKEENGARHGSLPHGSVSAKKRNFY